MTSDESFNGDEFTPEQWERIRAHIRARGITFEVFLPESQAEWLRTKIAAGMFEDAKEAAFMAVKNLQELHRHPEVRQALLAAMLNDGIDSGPGISTEEFRRQHRAVLREYANMEPPLTSPSKTLCTPALDYCAKLIMFLTRALLPRDLGIIFPRRWDLWRPLFRSPRRTRACRAFVRSHAPCARPVASRDRHPRQSFPLSLVA